MAHLQTQTTESKPSFYERFGGNAPENYQRYFVPTIGAPFAAKLMEHARLRPGERVLDVACGTGVVTRLAADRVASSGSVAGLDLNPGMLAVARSVTPAEASIRWHQSTAEAIPLPDASFDVVLCQLGLQFFQNPSAALGHMRRVLAPKGRVALSVVGPTPRLFVVFADALSRHVSPEMAGFVGKVFSIDDPAKLRELVSTAGFVDVEVRTQRMLLRLPPPEEFLWQYSFSTPMAGPISELEPERRRALERDVVAGWQDLVDKDGLKLELTALFATANA